MPTKQDVIAAAFLRLGMGAGGDTVSGEHSQIASNALGGIVAELDANFPLYWATSGDIPEAVLQPLAELLAVDLAPTFSAPPPISRGRAYLRVMALARPDDREDARAEYF